MTLTMTDSDMDLSRDILKSETANLELPELELAMTSGSLGGRYAKFIFSHFGLGPAGPQFKHLGRFEVGMPFIIT